MPGYTVFGVHDTANGQFVVAGVADGEIRAIDVDPGGDGWQRIAHFVDADTPEMAEEIAIRRVLEGD